MDNAELLFLQLLLQAGREKLTVDKVLTSQKSLQFLQLGRDIWQCRNPLHRLGHADSQHLHVFSLQWPRIAEIQAGSDPYGIFSDQKLLPVMQGRHRNRSERSVRDEDQGIDERRRKVRLQRSDQPVIKFLSVRQVLPRGSF